MDADIYSYMRSQMMDMVVNQPEVVLQMSLKSAIKLAEGGDAWYLMRLSRNLLTALESGELIFNHTPAKADDEAESKAEDWNKTNSDDEEYIHTDPLSKKQKGFISGLCKTLQLDRHELDRAMFPSLLTGDNVIDTDDITEGQAIKIIDTLLKMKEAL